MQCRPMRSSAPASGSAPQQPEAKPHSGLATERAKNGTGRTIGLHHAIAGQDWARRLQAASHSGTSTWPGLLLLLRLPQKLLNQCEEGGCGWMQFRGKWQPHADGTILLLRRRQPC